MSHKTMECPFRNKFLTDIPGEIWKEIDSFNDSYMVSSYGRIKSLDRYVNHKSGKPLLIKGKIISQTIYKFRNKTKNDDIVALKTVLSKENKRYDFQVRRLVYQTFIGPLDPDLYVINID